VDPIALETYPKTRFSTRISAFMKNF